MGETRRQSIKLLQLKPIVCFDFSSCVMTKRSSFTMIWVVLVFFFSASLGIPQDDVRCLRGVKSSLGEPRPWLRSWNFDVPYTGFICTFVGVSCWNEVENRIIELNLRNMELSGPIPESLQYCGSLQVLDLSHNNLSGPIPFELYDWLPFLVRLDLSNNQFSGPIPVDLAKCLYLNHLILSNNQFSGSVPREFSTLDRLKKFSVRNNHLTGEIPSFFDGFDAFDFDGNVGLCGGPLETKCSVVKKKNVIVIIVAGLFGSSSLSLGVGLWFCLRFRRRNKRIHRFGKIVPVVGLKF